MNLTIIISIAAAYLAIAPAFIRAPSDWDKVAFKATPTVLALLLGFFAFGRFMGWPI